MKIQGNTFIVTGGASGLGESAVRRLFADGANVVILDLNEASGKKLEQELGKRSLFVKCNICDEESVKKAIEASVSRFGGIHGVANCAGIALGQRVVGKNGPHSLDDFTKVININVVGTFNVLRLAAAQMVKQQPLNEDGERGIIINIASIAAFEGQIGQAAYSASKGAIVGMTLPIARELGAFGIRCVTIAPGIFDTPMMANMPPKVRESLEKQPPFPKRLGRGEEFAQLIANIITNVMINGTTLRLDGAIRMSAL